MLYVAFQVVGLLILLFLNHFNYYSVVGYSFTSSLWYVGQYLARLYNVWRSLLGEIAIARFD